MFLMPWVRAMVTLEKPTAQKEFRGYLLLSRRLATLSALAHLRPNPNPRPLGGEGARSTRAGEGVHASLSFGIGASLAEAVFRSLPGF